MKRDRATKKNIEEAIQILDIAASEPVAHHFSIDAIAEALGLRPLGVSASLACSAFYAVPSCENYSNDHEMREETASAAAMLRDGYLPPEWAHA